ncbi:MAG TPA: PAS domain S-box protein, partial [Candidatus Ozemobacteraceae bacterium]|nr:PAS domain S-box protein [Candidatus Ozemobacteraceae bacterium]
MSLHRMFADLPVSRKLTFVTVMSSALVLLLAIGFAMAMEWHGFHLQFERELELFGAVIGENCVAALTFNDPRAAEDTLKSLRVHPQITRVEVYTASQTLFASFGFPRPKGSELLIPPLLASTVIRVSPHEMEVLVPIRLADQYMGTVVLNGSLDALIARQKALLHMGLLIFCASVALAFLLSAYVSHLISSPLLQLAETARAVSQTRNYGLRGPDPGTREEIGTLAGCFNQMLDQIQSEIQKRELAEREQARLATAIDQSAETIIVTDPAGIIQYVNPAFERISGYARHEVIGQNVFILRSGEQTPEFYQDLWAVLHEGRSWQGHFINRRKDGTTYEEDVTISPVRSAQGEVTNYVSVHRDVTREIALKQQLLQAQKLEALGTLAGGVAHDFNNILGAILGFADLARSDLPPKHIATESLQEIIFGARRAQELVRQILAFSRKLEQSRQPMDLVRVVRNAIKFIRPSLPASIEIRTLFEPEIAPVLIDVTQINQILLNLASNASHAMENQKGTLEIRVFEEVLDASRSEQLPGCKHGPHIVMAVSDTGSGIRPEVLPHLFEPFFTTKSVGKGTGLGLSVVHGIVKEHGGDLRVQSKVGQGTTMFVYFPRYLDELPVETPEGEWTLAGKSDLFKGKVLAVDDEPALVLYAKRVLEMVG